MKAKNRQERLKKGYILLEGKRLIADAIQAGADLLTIFVTDRQILDVCKNFNRLNFKTIHRVELKYTEFRTKLCFCSCSGAHFHHFSGHLNDDFIKKHVIVRNFS